MHGLINRFIEEFLRARYGEALWREVAGDCAADPRGFHSWRTQPEAMTGQLATRAAARIGVRLVDLAEDAGGWLAQCESIRRLLRFGGRDYAEFLASIDQLPGRAEMVVPGLGLPALRVIDEGPERFRVRVLDGHWLWTCVLAGLLRQMADDFGALALISRRGWTITVEVPEREFAEGRSFALVAAQEAEGDMV
ncbi:heme NO-binding domain-containing protein [Paracoccus sp. Z118]|uniref:heme NO-binding domain-containing protein n=1 Tax=Paracoccus sp. Z118 TaxID=2851017 RepID=UPI001C2BB52A|nr:heme NO-binding domain-containing protein [Paracoccus sp. Z118]MBV0890417.1 heme NO-binding domain-containing protein [Paracoccus sp. Z118]